MLTPHQLKVLTDWQIKRQKEFRSIPDEGMMVKHLDKEYIVYPNVFSPTGDSKPLLEHFVVKRNDTVLDLCTGVGVIGIHAAYKGAGNVVASDINPDALRSARANARLHGFENIFDIRLSDMFNKIQSDEQFDVITCNPPFREKTAHNLVEASQWDTDLHSHRKLFDGIRKHLKQDGRAYLSQANYGPLDTINQLAQKKNLLMRKIAQQPSHIEGVIWYAFELTHK